MTNDPVRPVGARPLKSARDTLRPHLRDANVLDLFAGHGRFGEVALLEAAARVVFVERDRARVEAMKKKLSGDRSHFFALDVFVFLNDRAPEWGPFDVIFADPPFPHWNPKFTQKLLEASARVAAPEGIFLVKHPSRVIPSLEVFGWKKWRDSHFGESGFSYLTYEKRS